MLHFSQNKFAHLLAFDQALLRAHQPVSAVPVVASACLRNVLEKTQLRQTWQEAHRYFRISRRHQDDAKALLLSFARYPSKRVARALLIAFDLSSPDPVQPDWPFEKAAAELELLQPA